MCTRKHICASKYIVVLKNSKIQMRPTADKRGINGGPRIRRPTRRTFCRTPGITHKWHAMYGVVIIHDGIRGTQSAAVRLNYSGAVPVIPAPVWVYRASSCRETIYVYMYVYLLYLPTETAWDVLRKILNEPRA